MDFKELIDKYKLEIGGRQTVDISLDDVEVCVHENCFYRFCTGEL